MNLRSIGFGFGLALLALATPCSARDVIIGRVSEQAAIDPHFNNAGNDYSTMKNIYEGLIAYDLRQQMVPALAESWSMSDPLTWNVKLRQGVKFHNSNELTADDVAFSLDRATHVPNSPSSFVRQLGDIASISVTGRYTLTIVTKYPAPLMFELAGQVYILNRAASEGATTSDYNSGKAAIGTGPYRFVSWARGDNTKFARFDEYWGGKPEFENVTVRFITNPAARVAALLTGAVDVADGIPAADIAGLQSNPAVTISSAPTSRVVFLELDSARDQSPFVTDPDGKPLDRNPLRDRRVRIALSKLINRTAIVDRVLLGGGVAAGQLVPEGQGGYDAALIPIPFDPEGALKLLAEAGYPNGFGLVIHGPNDRFPQDAALAQALAQMLTRGRIKVREVATMPFNIYIGQATDQKFSAFIFAYNGPAANAADPLRSTLMTRDLSKGNGGVNRGRYSNAQFDEVLQQALGTFDEAKRNRLMAEATKIGMEDGGLLPIYWQRSFWGARKGFTYEANGLDESSARFAHAAP